MAYSNLYHVIVWAPEAVSVRVVGQAIHRLSKLYPSIEVSRGDVGLRKAGVELVTIDYCDQGAIIQGACFLASESNSPKYLKSGSWSTIP